MFGWPSAISFVNGRVLTPEGEARSIRIRRHIVAIDQPPGDSDHVIDLDGRIVLPGLINAHDHLELNHYGLLNRRQRYANAREWIDDLRPLIRTDAGIRAKSQVKLADRLFVGGLKNLLAGVTTVAHHNPRYREFGLHFPVRLLERFGWAHSLALENGPVGAHGEPGGAVAERVRATPRHWPFIVHAAEGVDADAAGEVDTLDVAGVLQSNCVIVHGVAIPPERWVQLFARGVGLVWCPASNLFLFGRTVPMPRLLELSGARSHITLGSDSRVTGSRDLLDELRTAATLGVKPEDLVHMVTSAAADVLRLDDRGRLRVGLAADLTALPASSASAPGALLSARRSDICLVVRRGTPVLAEPSLRTVFAARRVHVGRIEVDGRERIAEAGLARRIGRCSIQEQGVQAITATRLALASGA